MNEICPMQYLEHTLKKKNYSLFIFNSTLTDYSAFYLATLHPRQSDPLENAQVVKHELK